MKILFATVLIASLSAAAFAQAPAKPVNTKKPVSVKKVPAATQRQAIEEATPLEDADPRVKLSEADIEVAKRVHVGEIQCELGQKVSIKPLKREGFFLVARGINRFVMHPVESRTGAIRLEDPARGALWLQLGNKSMLMNQKEGKRLADECQSPEQLQFAKDMKPVNLLEPAPAADAAAPATAASPAVPAAPAAAAPVAPEAPATPVAPPAAPANTPTAPLAPAAAAPSAAPAPAQ